MGQDVNVCVWSYMRGRRRIRRSSNCTAVTDQHAAAMGILQAGLTIAAMLSPEANHASRMQWITIAILSILGALAGGFLYKGKKTQ